MQDEAALEWLLASKEPAIRLMARRDLLGEPVDDSIDVLKGLKVRKLLSGQKKDGSFGNHPYTKWTGAHWRLVSLVELQVPPKEPKVMAALETVFDWILDPKRRRINVIAGLPRRCASMEGNVLAVASLAGAAEDPRSRQLAESLIEWQWPDGGWNCDIHATGKRSSFHESHATAWRLHEYASATGGRKAARAARRTAELFLEHRIFRKGGTGDPINKRWVTLHYPSYWHYDFLQTLLILSRMGLAADARAADALDLLEERRPKDGRWRPGNYWWNPPGSSRAQEVVDWGRGKPNEMITLNALRVLKAAGRLDQL